MREMVSRSSCSWDQAGMTQRIASNVISTGATDFFFVIDIFVVNIAEPHVRTKNSENGGLYTAPNLFLLYPHRRILQMALRCPYLTPKVPTAWPSEKPAFFLENGPLA